MKRIGIDARLYFQTGVGVYLRNLLYELQRADDKTIEFCVYVMREDVEKIQFTSNRFMKRAVNERWHSLGEQIGFAKTVLNDNLDLMHFTYFSYPVMYSRPFIATVHDLTPLLFKTGKASTKNKVFYELKHKVFSFILASQIKNARHIITPTATVMGQIIEHYGSDYKNKITPVGEGINYELIKAKENNTLNTTYGSGFFLYVGNFYPHKNVESLIRAYAAVKTEKKLILLGPKDFFTERIHTLIETLHQTDRILFFHNANTSDLRFFYKNACALVHPSRSEGFGLPVIEAMYFNLPIIASKIPVFEELTAGNYIPFYENKIEDITQTIASFITLPRIFSYTARMQNYSFKTMAQKTLAFYHTYAK